MLFHFTTANHFVLGIPALMAVFNYGYLGVEIFFVISGFVIPYAMASEGYRFAADARTFFMRRIVRLEPAYLTSVVLAIALAYASSHTPGFRGRPFDIDPVTVAAHVAYLVGIFGKEWVNPVYWTLAVEFQYYIAMIVFAPLLISGVRSRATLFLAAVFLLSLVPTDRDLIFVHLPFFALGFVAFLYHGARMPRFPLILWAMAFSVLCYLNEGVVAAVVGLVAMLLIFVPVPNRVPVLSFLGTISYSLYLVHVPVGARVINLAARLPPSLSVQIAGMIVAAAVSLFAAWALWRFVEMPSMRMAKRVFGARCPVAVSAIGVDASRG